MGDQNIYDNQAFFDGYRKLRENPGAANSIVEKPALFSLLPNLTDKTVLDLGCGYGENCKEFAKKGARKVVGVDISEKMLDVANAERMHENVSFMRMSMNDLSGIHDTYDVVLSSLAVHYIEDFDSLLQSIYRVLNDKGFLIFSQEHPFTTALINNEYWSKDPDGSILHYNLTNYSVPGERRTYWFVENVLKYHRSFSSIINSLIQAGFVIEKVLEPVPDEATMNQFPAYRKYCHKPDFLFIRARKQASPFHDPFNEP